MPESELSVVIDSRLQNPPPPVSSISQPAEVSGNRLRWESSIWGSHPNWVVEPSMARIEEAIAPHLQQLQTSSRSLAPAHDIDIEFLAEGAFNKTYTATLATRSHCQSYIVRVSLPVDAYYKMASEVATIKYLRTQTSIPIPEVFAWDAGYENPIGYEWMLMERVAGLPLREVWYPENKTGSVDWDIKQRTVEAIAESVAQMWRLKFPVGGSLYLADGIGVPGTVYNDLTRSEPIFVTVGRVVALEFFWENHLQLTGIERGPFRSSGPWLESRLRFVIADAERLMNQAQIGKSELEQAVFMKMAADRLLRQLPDFFPLPQAQGNTPHESFALSHPDLTGHNILVDPSGALVSIIDWECTNALPTWAACQIPYLLDSLPPRTEKPREEDYSDSLYLEHLEEYEQTILRQLFLARMSEIEPSWVEEFESQEGNRRRDFETAVSWAGGVSGFHNRALQKWLDMLEGQGGSGARDYHSLRD